MMLIKMKNVAMMNDDVICMSVCLNGMCQQKCFNCINTDAKLPNSDTKNTKSKHTVAKHIPRSKEFSNPPLPSTTRLREYFSQFKANTNFVGKGGRGDITPTKRKLLDSGHVSKIVQSFDVAADSLPGESDKLESPAKRRRLYTGVKHLAS